ncbi:MAG: hypothetical protein WDN29_10730 [Methylovirgula sp.]
MEIEDQIRRLAEKARDRDHKFIITLQEATLRASQAAIKALLLVNGGSAVSILAFIGTVAGQGRVDITHLQRVAASLFSFAIGVGLATICALLAYARITALGL